MYSSCKVCENVPSWQHRESKSCLCLGGTAWKKHLLNKQDGGETRWEELLDGDGGAVHFDSNECGNMTPESGVSSWCGIANETRSCAERRTDTVF